MAITLDTQKGPFEPMWNSLRTFTCPAWFRDAKLGIWAHWGPQVVPQYGDWYARRMYEEGSDQYLYHWRQYGHPSKFGYKDIVKLWKAERFDPEALMDLYAAAGAKYFVAQAAHHDNFDNWDSKHNPWNAVRVGPKKNICALWQAAARKRGLRFGLTEHLGATYSWWASNKGADASGPYAGVPYDGNDPAYESLYLPNRDEFAKQNRPWLTANTWWHEHWFKRVKDLIDQHQPDLLYSDSVLPFDDVGLSAVAHLYNTSAKLHGGANEAVYNQKDTKPEVYTIGVLDIERGGLTGIAEHPWQTDTCVAGWFYDVRARYKTPRHVIAMFIDIVSNNGNLLLNFTQRADGTLDDECTYILKRMADWIGDNGEGIYATRPWKRSNEGPTTDDSKGFDEPELKWTEEDFRFTTKGEDVYAFIMKWPNSARVCIKSLASGEGAKVRDVALLGSDGSLPFTQDAGGLYVDLLRDVRKEFPHAIRVRLG
jgi:alpha-L-fucosidase